MHSMGLFKYVTWTKEKNEKLNLGKEKDDEENKVSMEIS